MSAGRAVRAATTFALIVAPLIALIACSTPATTSTTPPGCATDLDCGAHRYCAVALICRADCVDDVDCLGVSPAAQCNAHGRCIPPVVAHPDAAVDGAPTFEGGVGP